MLKLTRGQFLGAAAATVGGLSLSGCTEIARRLSAPEFPDRIGTGDAGPQDPVWRGLNRLAYGPRPGDVELVRAMGVNAYVEEQLAPERIEESRAGWMRLLPMDTLNMDAADAEDYDMATYGDYGQGQASIELQQACVLRSVYSARQLEQVMVEFWTDHFNVSQLKAECSWLKTVDDRLMRKHALGKFRDLVSASAHSPAMLFYLDNDKNRKRDPKNHSGPNENYARELLELHTLGVHGGYTLHDIQEVARCFTGWSYKKGFQFWPGDFTFHADQHDTGPKEVLGIQIPPRDEKHGMHDGEQVIDIVCKHPSTAHFVAAKMCRRFVADRGPKPLIERLAGVFQKTDGDIRQMLSELFHSEEFQRGGGPKFKRPFDFAVSALRAVNADTNGDGVLFYLEQMGQLPYKWTMPDGYPDRVEAWTPSLLARWNFALDLVRDKIHGTTIQPAALVKATGCEEPQDVVRALCRAVVGRSLPEPALQQMASLLGTLPAPERNQRHRHWRRKRDQEDGTRECLALVLASPQFQWR